MEKTVLITGATSGIGYATARLLAESRYPLIVCGRRKGRLEQLVEECAPQTRIYPLEFDVRNKEEVDAAIASLPEAFQPINVLINNAGNAHGLAPIQEGNPEDWDAMLDINVKGLLYVSKAVLPQMIRRKAGHIINIGSVAGKQVYPNGNVYCASKYAVDAISQGMRIDLLSEGIKVSGINPGMVETEFSLVRFKGDQQKADKVYEGVTPLTPEDVAEVICFVISRPAHVNIADLLLFPASQANATIIRKN